MFIEKKKLVYAPAQVRDLRIFKLVNLDRYQSVTGFHRETGGNPPSPWKRTLRLERGSISVRS